MVDEYYNYAMETMFCGYDKGSDKGSFPQRETKDMYYLNIAKEVSKRSTCLKRRYGCVIVKNDEIIATGYNGSPRGEINCCDVGECKRMGEPHNSGKYDECKSVHAEQNAMLVASRKDMLGSTMYLVGQDKKDNDWFTIKNTEPCPVCERMIKNAGIKKVITHTGVIQIGNS